MNMEELRIIKDLLTTLFIVVPISLVCHSIVKIISRSITMREQLEEIVGSLEPGQYLHSDKRARLLEVVRENARKIQGF